MPSRMIHYCIGREILKKISLQSSSFTIGILAPDAHDNSFDGVGSSHYKTSYKPGIDNYPVIDLGAFKAKYFTRKYNDFILGYYCHLVTDNLWTRLVYYEYLQCDEAEKNIRVEKVYHDYHTLNRILVDTFNMERIILNIPNHIFVEEISLVNLQRIVKEFNNDFNFINKSDDLLILTERFVKSFVYSATEDCLHEINSLIENYYC